jgi:hypothetical protein
MLEKLKILKYNFINRLKFIDEYEVIWNDSVKHNLTDRLSRVGNFTTIKALINKIKIGLEATLEHTKNRTRPIEVVVYFNISEFILVVRVNPKKKTLYIKTILAYSMKAKGNLVLNLDESLKFELFSEVFSETEPAFLDDLIVENGILKYREGNLFYLINEFLVIEA